MLWTHLLYTKEKECRLIYCADFCLLVSSQILMQSFQVVKMRKRKDVEHPSLFFI